jgi:hypothetical protein
MIASQAMDECRRLPPDLLYSSFALYLGFLLLFLFCHRFAASASRLYTI